MTGGETRRAPRITSPLGRTDAYARATASRTMSDSRCNSLPASQAPCASLPGRQQFRQGACRRVPFESRPERLIETPADVDGVSRFKSAVIPVHVMGAGHREVGHRTKDAAVDGARDMTGAIVEESRDLIGSDARAGENGGRAPTEQATEIRGVCLSDG